MVPAVRPVRLLVKLPVPVPFVVWLPLIVGFGEVLQHTPRAVTDVLPELITKPPLVAEVCVILLTVDVVETVGSCAT